MKTNEDIAWTNRRWFAEQRLEKTIDSMKWYLEPHGTLSVMEISAVVVREWVEQLKESRRLMAEVFDECN